MVFGRKKNESAAAGVKTTALVVAADGPVDNASRLSNIGRGMVYILADTGSEPIYVGRNFLLDEDHWLVPGMRVPVTIDPAAPKSFEIGWDAIPSIEERAKANDPTLADPRGTEKAVAEVMRATGLWGGADMQSLPGRRPAHDDRLEPAFERQRRWRYVAAV